MKKTQGSDEYLEAIYVLQSEGHTVLGSVLADYLGVSRPTVTQTLQRLTHSGYVMDTDSREVQLTEQGIERAETIIRRHRLIERWLTDVLGLDWAEAHEEASRLEHAISERVENRLAQALGYPTTCPHGNLIPGAGSCTPGGIPLTEIKPPAVAELVRIVEVAEEDPNLLRFLQTNGLVPGARLELIEQASSESSIHVKINQSQIEIPQDIASRILAVQSA